MGGDSADPTPTLSQVHSCSALPFLLGLSSVQCPALKSCPLTAFHHVTSCHKQLPVWACCCSHKAASQLGTAFQASEDLHTFLTAVVVFTWVSPARGCSWAASALGSTLLCYLFCISLFTESSSEALLNISSCSQ